MAKGWTDTTAPFDYDKVDDSEFSTPEVGFYRVDLVKAEPEKTKTGKPGVDIVCAILSKADGTPCKKGRLFDKLTLTQEAVFRAKNLSSALHIEAPRSGNYDDAHKWCMDALVAAKEGLFVRVDHKPDFKDPTQMRATIGRYYDADECHAAMERKAPSSPKAAEEPVARAAAGRRR